MGGGLPPSNIFCRLCDFFFEIYKFGVIFKLWPKGHIGWVVGRLGVLRPYYNLNGNGCATTSQDTDVTNRDLSASHGATRAKGQGELSKAG